MFRHGSSCTAAVEQLEAEVELREENDELEQQPELRAGHLGFGRIVISKKEAAILLVNLV